jgi:hypothetical protein
MANETVAIPDNLRAKAAEKGWPIDLVEQALGAGATAEQISGYMDQGVTADQARQFLAAQEMDDAEPRMVVRGNREDIVRIAKSAGVVGTLLDYDPRTQQYAAADALA